MENDLRDILNKLQEIDCSIYLSALKPVVIFCLSSYLTKKIIDNHTIIRDFKPKSTEKVKLPPKLSEINKSIDCDKILTKHYGDEIINFIETLQKNFKKENLNYFYNNINGLKITPQDSNENRSFYNVKENKAKILVVSNITHELLHLASSIYKDNITYSGFRQAHFNVENSFYDIGRGVNEGYTCLLDKRYFTKSDKYGYILEMNIVEKLEEIIGKYKMESLYLNADLYGLIKELEKYITIDRINEFITGVDFINLNVQKEKKTFIEKTMIEKSLKNVYEFLLEVYIIKLKKQFIEEEIDINVLEEKIALYVTALGMGIEYCNEKYIYLPIKSVEKIIQKTLQMKDVAISHSEIMKEKL